MDLNRGSSSNPDTHSGGLGAIVWARRGSGYLHRALGTPRNGLEGRESMYWTLYAAAFDRPDNVIRGKDSIRWATILLAITISACSTVCGIKGTVGAIQFGNDRRRCAC